MRPVVTVPLGLVLSVLCMLEASARADETAGKFEARTIEDETGTHRYVLYTPPSFDPSKKYPLVLFLHGSGERGTDNERQIRVGLGPALRENPSRCPAPVLFPQAESKARMPIEVWSPSEPDGKRALEIVDRTMKELSIDGDRLYLTGISMGGIGTWRQAMADPDRWAAIVPVCGGGNSLNVQKITHLPTWCFHGGADLVVPTAFSRQIIKALQKAGGDPKYTEYPGVGHNSWDRAYREPELWTWLFAQRKGTSTNQPQ